MPKGLRRRSPRSRKPPKQSAPRDRPGCRPRRRHRKLTHHKQFDGGDFPVGHPEAGHPLVEMTAVGLVPLLPPNQPPEERERRIQDEIGERAKTRTGNWTGVDSAATTDCIPVERPEERPPTRIPHEDPRREASCARGTPSKPPPRPGSRPPSRTGRIGEDQEKEGGRHGRLSPASRRSRP